MKNKAKRLAVVGVMTAVLCLVSPWAIPIGQIPLSLTTLAVFLGLYLLGWKWGTISYCVYLLIGLVGVPVFSGFSGGVGKLLGPTGGYIVGMLPMAVIAGLGMEKCRNAVGKFLWMLLATAACYACGTAWFCISTATSVYLALSLCVLPFLPGDVAKIIVSIFLGKKIKRRIQRSG